MCFRVRRQGRRSRVAIPMTNATGSSARKIARIIPRPRFWSGSEPRLRGYAWESGQRSASSRSSPGYVFERRSSDASRPALRKVAPHLRRLSNTRSKRRVTRSKLMEPDARAPGRSPRRRQLALHARDGLALRRGLGDRAQRHPPRATACVANSCVGVNRPAGTMLNDGD